MPYNREHHSTLELTDADKTLVYYEKIHDNAMQHKLLILICNIMAAYSLTCDEILEFPSKKKLTLQELQTVPLKDIVQCLAHLGKEELEISEADFIWHSLITFYDGIPNIPESVLMLLHWVTPAVLPDDYANITLSSIDVIQNFGLNYNLNDAQLAAIADRVRKDFAGKEPEDYTYYDLTALRQILCAFNRSEISRIQPSAYRESALIIGKLEHCGSEAMVGFASLALHKGAFGSPETWLEGTLDVIGVVADYLPQELLKRYKLKSYIDNHN